MTLFGVEHVLPRDQETDALAGTALREQAIQAVDALSAAVGEDPQTLYGRVLKLLNLPRLDDADDHDLREIVRELRICEQEDRRVYRARLRRVTRVDRPGGIGRLPRPRSVKSASAPGTCALCGDAYTTGELIGRPPFTEDLPYVPIGWLCWHCLVQRRQQPRRRDVLLRIFHALFAGVEGVGLNGHECGVLLDWLTGEPALANSKPWTADPLENTLVRLRTSAADANPATWLSAQTAHTIVAVLKEAPDSPDTTTRDGETLEALVQHLAEWETNPAGVRRSQYGTGWRYRQRVLQLTDHPTPLSERGGPFHLFQCRVNPSGQLVETE
ncbi:hypothetical protein ACGFWE_40850 [Streptomyces sp. NPDC048523]|uniref:hypothetical protein n=1 Tax=Streptomyces sp. NPDC048523 TaxID=3365567 RepID=UPI0037143002